MNADPQASAYPETFSRRAGWRLMTEDPGTLRARLNKLAALVELARLSRSEEDRARMERSIQLVSWALQEVARARRWRGDRFRQVSRQLAIGRRIGVEQPL